MSEEQGSAREQRVEEIKGKLERGEELSPEERDYLQSEGIDVPGEEGGGPPPV